MKPGPSALELLLPAGQARSSLVLGVGCPERLFPTAPPARGNGADLVILAPARNEQRAAWWAAAVRTAAQELADGGIVYALATGSHRTHVIELFADERFVVGPPIAHRPDWLESTHLVPLGGPAARYAFSQLPETRSAVWNVASRGVTRYACGFALQTLPELGLFASRQASGMPLEWLFTLAGASPMGRDWLVRLGWRGRAGAAVVYWFANDHRRPTGVAKVPAGIAGDDMGAEDVALRTLGPAARAAGARVPEVVRSASRESAGALLLTAVEGHPAARLLARRPQQLPALLDSLVAWLSAWNFATYVAADDTGGGHLLEAVAVARKVENRAPEAAGYASWLDGLCAEVASQVPTVAAHNDLTMWNVLVGSGNEISVLDWEAARPDGLPLADLFYTLVDAVAAATKSARLDALRACFTAPGRVLHVARALASRFGYVERLPPEVIDVCFHACWLLHADDALRRRAGQTDEEFIQIAEWLARERPRVSALLLT